MAHIPLLDEIDTFVRINQLSESAFGRLAVNDWKLLRQLRAGRRMWPDTEDRVRGFMASYQPKTRSEAGQ
jgi:hypothetical protein